MMIKGDNPDVDQHVLTIGDVYVSMSESGYLKIDTTVKGRWKAYTCFIAGDDNTRRCILARLYEEAEGIEHERVESGKMGGQSIRQ